MLARTYPLTFFICKFITTIIH